MLDMKEFDALMLLSDKLIATYFTNVDKLEYVYRSGLGGTPIGIVTINLISDYDILVTLSKFDGSVVNKDIFGNMSNGIHSAKFVHAFIDWAFSNELAK